MISTQLKGHDSWAHNTEGELLYDCSLVHVFLSFLASACHTGYFRIVKIIFSEFVDLVL